MRFSICNSATPVLCFVGAVFVARGVDVATSEAQQTSSESKVKACENFYQHVCSGRAETFDGTTPHTLRRHLQDKIIGILENSDIEEEESQNLDDSRVDNEVNILKMAKKLYSVCVQDKHKASKEDVRDAVTKMLQSLGIHNWPLTKHSEEPATTYVELLTSTGLRPFATIASVPDRIHPSYIITMMSNARNLYYYGTDTAQNWQKRFGSKFPFMTGLSTDFTKARRTLANDYYIGVHLDQYFNELAKYLETLNVKQLANYLGWFFVREVADVLTLEIRMKLNQFMKVISKPGVAKDLSPRSCIEKLIGYHAVMEEGISYLYLNRFFREEAISKASVVAKHVNVAFHEMIRTNSWMDTTTHEKMSKWMNDLQYQMGAPANLLSKEYVKGHYDLVKPIDEESLVLLFFAYKENNFFQTIRLNKEGYDRKKIWPVSSLATDGRYSEHYVSLGIPAGAMQESIFKYNETCPSIFGSLGTLTAEKLTGGFTDEGRVGIDRGGAYEWTKETKKEFKKLLTCLKRKSNLKSSLQKGQKNDRQERFDESGKQYHLAWKLRDHVGLRASFKAFNAFISECSGRKTTLQEDEAKLLTREFFRSYAHRHCGRDATNDDEHRVNFAVKTFKEFALAFDCKDAEPMRIEDNCHIVT